MSAGLHPDAAADDDVSREDDPESVDHDLVGDADEVDGDAAGAASESEGEADGASQAAAHSEEQALLLKNAIRKGLSDAQKTADRKNFAYVRLDLQGVSLMTLEGDLSSYPELLYVNVSHNTVCSVAPLRALHHLLAINAQHNQVTETIEHAGPLKHLQILQLDHNQLTTLFSSPQALIDNFPNLFMLTASHNRLSSLFPHHSNKLSNSISSLQLLDLSFNSLSTLPNLSFLPHLHTLLLRHNLLETLSGIEKCAMLTRLDVGDNKLSGLKNELKRLTQLPQLSHLVLSGNAGLVDDLDALNAEMSALFSSGASSSESTDLLTEALLVLPALQVLDGKRVRPQHRIMLAQVREERRIEAERKAQEKAEEERLADEEKKAAERERKKEEEGDEENPDAEESAEDKDDKDELDKLADEMLSDPDEVDGGVGVSVDASGEGEFEAEPDADADADPDAPAPADGEADDEHGDAQNAHDQSLEQPDDASDQEAGLDENNDEDQPDDAEEQGDEEEEEEEEAD